jgi:hypothetical protein
MLLISIVYYYKDGSKGLKARLDKDKRDLRSYKYF